MVTPYKSLTDELIDIIKESKMPLYKIAERSGVSRRSIYNWIYNNCSPTLESAVFVIRALGYDIKITEVEIKKYENKRS